MSTPSFVRRTAAGDAAGGLNYRPILDVVKQINSERNLRRLVTMILDTAIELSNATRGTLAIFKEKSFNAELSRQSGQGDIKHGEISSLSPVLSRVRATEQIVSIDDLSTDPDLRPSALEPGKTGLSILCLPLHVKSRLMGAVYLDNTDQVS